MQWSQRQSQVRWLTSQDIEGVSSSDESHRDEGSSSSVSKDNRDKVVSVLSRLKAPRASDLARKRKVAVNPPKGKRGCRGATAAEPKNITAQQRVKEFPDQPLCVSNRKLFCNACREEMSLKMSSMRKLKMNMCIVVKNQLLNENIKGIIGKKRWNNGR